MWVVRRPDIAFAVHKAARRTHGPTVDEWKLAKRILRYLGGTKELRLRMRGDRGSQEVLNMAPYSDADFVADKRTRSPSRVGWSRSIECPSAGRAGRKAGSRCRQ